MIPIECPKCGRGGSVPPDRLNARLVCKACHTVFHLDNTGRMVLGEPQSFDMKSTKSRADEVSGLADFDFAQTWSDIPKFIKYGIPAILLAAFGYLYIDFSGGTPNYLTSAQSIVQAVAGNDKSRTLSYASSGTNDGAEKWFEMLHADFEKSGIDSKSPVNPQLFSGNAEHDSEISLMVVMSGSSGTVSVSLPMKKEGEAWKLEGMKAFEDINRGRQNKK